LQNIEATIDGKILILKIDLTQELGPSSSGKSTKVASSEGNVSVPGHEDIKIGVNVYKQRPR